MRLLTDKRLLFFLLPVIFWGYYTPVLAKQVVAVGPAQAAYFICYKSGDYLLPTNGQKITICNPYDTLCAGGGAFNVSLGFKRLGYSIVPFFKTGNDEIRSLFIKKLEAEGITTHALVTTNQALTGTSYVIPGEKGDSCMLAYRGANEFLCESEIPVKDIAESDIVYVTSLNGRAENILIPLLTCAKKHNACTIVNPGSEQLAHATNLIQALSLIDVFLVNDTEADLFWGLLSHQVHNSLKKWAIVDGPDFKFIGLCSTLLASGVSIVMITCGAAGAFVATKNMLYYCPALSTSVVNTVGAGDAFGVGFVGELLRKHTLHDVLSEEIMCRALMCGIVNSTSVVSFLDANKGLLNQEEMRCRIRDMGTCGVQCWRVEIE